MNSTGQTPSLEMRALQIANVGMGEMKTVSQLREAVKAEALKQLREVAGMNEPPSFYER